MGSSLSKGTSNTNSRLTDHYQKKGNEHISEVKVPVATAAARVVEEEASVKENKRECPFKMFWDKKPSTSHDETNNNNAASVCPVKKNSKPPSSEGRGGGGCPVKHGSTSNKEQVAYNVYSQPIDPKNQMPTGIANQLPTPTQTVELSTERVKSNIPKGGVDNETWTYPSPQMFYNALARKGKTTPTTHTDDEEEQNLMESVVAIHNTMNETTWSKILEWEDLLVDTGAAENSTPKLLRFCGRPSDLSPKARMKHLLFGHPLPFDRHDWTLVRSNGEEVRYVIDYYYDDTGSSVDTKVKNIMLDVRPALDSLTSIYHRTLLMPLAARQFAPNGKVSHFKPMPILPSTELKQQIRESERVWEDIQKRGAMLLSSSSQEQQQSENNTRPNKLTDADAILLAKSFAISLKECQTAQKAVNLCKSDQECAQASLTLTMCMAKLLCPIQHKAVVTSVHAPSSEKEEEEYNIRLDAALENAVLCIGQVHERVAWAKQDHPHFFGKGEK